MLICFTFKQLLQANRDRNTIKINAINPAIRGRYIRLHPRGWHGYPCLRAEFYGCPVGKLFIYFANMVDILYYNIIIAFKVDILRKITFVLAYITY